MKREKKLSIFIPFFNEEKNLKSTVSLVLQVARTHLENFEIILIDDGSTDSSVQVARELIQEKIRLLTLEKNMGFGRAYLSGFKESKFDFALYLCADGDVTKKELEDLLENWDGKSNQVQYCSNLRSRSKWRFFLSRLYTALLCSLTKTELNYFNGFNILSTKNKERLVVRDFGFSSQAYLLLHALKSGHETREYGITCKFNDSESKSINGKNILKTLHFFFYLAGSY